MRRPPLHRLRQFYDVRAFRSSLASLEALPQFAILGILSGLVTGLTILAFRGLIEFTLHLLLPEGPDAFESMSLLERGLTPIAGASCIALYFHLMKGQDLKMGVAQVLERLSHHQGYMSLRNFIVQFVAGALALISGQTGGREGPAIHLGAAASSLLGQRLSLPNNSIRVLVGCGAAAAIGSSFNTPIAGVIFAMEVILMEYTIAGFMPVILASVTGTLVVQFALGSESLFVVPSVGLSDWTEIPFIVLAGLMIGCIAAIFVRGVEALHPRLPGTQSLKLILAGAVTGVLGLGIPEVLGIGYDTVNLALAGGIGFFLLLGILVAKLVATTLSVSLGLPIGVVGPTLFIGAVCGAMLWHLSQSLGLSGTHPAFFVLLGMGAMMGATLNAPLAALMALMELTQNSEIILPAMLCIVVATITAVHGFKMKSLFETQLKLQGIQLEHTPMRQVLRRVSVETLMSTRFVRVKARISRAEAEAVIKRNPIWLLVESPNNPTFIVLAEDVARYLGEQANEDINLLEIPAIRRGTSAISWRATLDEAFDTIAHHSVGALIVTRMPAPGVTTPVGILLEEDIEAYSWRRRD